MITWAEMEALPRRSAALVRRADIPSGPGVYAWWLESTCVYVGEAKRSLRDRLGAHLAVRPDLSRSTLRRSVALVELGIPRAVSSQRPTSVTQAQADTVNSWLRACDLAWLECASGDEAHALEAALRAERLPMLNRI